MFLQVFPWAKLNQTKASVKLHVGLNHSGMLPEFVTLTEGSVADVVEARAFDFPRGSIVVCDKGYVITVGITRPHGACIL